MSKYLIFYFHRYVVIRFPWLFNANVYTKENLSGNFRLNKILKPQFSKKQYCMRVVLK